MSVNEYEYKDISTLPETNIAPEYRAIPKGKSSSNHPFLAAKMLVSGSVYYMGVSKNRGGENPQIIPCLIGFGTIIFTIHFVFFHPIFGNILPETNIFAPENQWLEDEIPFGSPYFQVLLLLVSGRVSIQWIFQVPVKGGR